MKKSILLLASLYMVFLISCSNDDPSTKSTFSIQQKQLLNKSSITGKQTTIAFTGTFDFSKVFIGVSKIEFEKEYEINDVEIEEEIEYIGNFSFDVLNETSSPNIPFVELDAGVYHELEFNIDNVLASGNSIEVFGSYTDNVNNYVFEFSSTMDEEFEIENENGINLNVNETVNFILMLQLESLFNGVDFSTATVDDDGVIRINSNSNSEIAALIESNLEDIMEFEDDNNDNDNS